MPTDPDPECFYANLQGLGLWRDLFCSTAQLYVAPAYSPRILFRALCGGSICPGKSPDRANAVKLRLFYVPGWVARGFASTMRGHFHTRRFSTMDIWSCKRILIKCAGNFPGLIPAARSVLAPTGGVVIP